MMKSLSMLNAIFKKNFDQATNEKKKFLKRHSSTKITQMVVFGGHAKQPGPADVSFDICIKYKTH